MSEANPWYRAYVHFRGWLAWECIALALKCYAPTDPERLIFARLVVQLGAWTQEHAK